MKAESYKFFVEHCYNQFVTHEAFHTSAVSKTKTKDITGSGLTDSSQHKTSGYVWIGSEIKLVHIPEGQADDVLMQTQDEDETGKKASELPNLEVKIEEEEEEEEHEPQQVQDDQQEGAGSHQGEVASMEPGDSSQLERPELPQARGPGDRYGNFIMSQFTLQEFLKIRQWVFDLTSNMSEEDREDQNLPLTVEEVNTMQMAMFVDVIATETHSSFMHNYPSFTQTNVDPDAFHDIRLACKRIRKENEHISIMTFLEEDNPELPPDPENKKEIEHMTPENTHLILETDNAVLIDCTVQWMNMLNEDLQKRIVERVTCAKKEAEDEQDVEDQEQEIKKEPEVPPSKVSMSTQTEPTENVSQPGSSRQREAPASDTSSRQREAAREEKNINDDDTAPSVKKRPTLVWSGQDISGNEVDSVLRELSHCFSDGYHSIWAGFYNLGFPALPSNRHMLWHKKYRQTNEQHRMSWFDIKEEIMMEEYVARHKDEKVLELSEDAKNNLAYSCSDPRLHIRARQEVNHLQKKQLADTKKILNPCVHLLKITSKTIVKFLMQSYFNCWLADTWERECLMKKN